MLSKCIKNIQIFYKIKVLNYLFLPGYFYLRNIRFDKNTVVYRKFQKFLTLYQYELCCEYTRHDIYSRYKVY